MRIPDTASSLRYTSRFDQRNEAWIIPHGCEGGLVLHVNNVAVPLLNALAEPIQGTVRLAEKGITPSE